MAFSLVDSGKDLSGFYNFIKFVLFKITDSKAFHFAMIYRFLHLLPCTNRIAKRLM